MNHQSILNKPMGLGLALMLVKGAIKRHEHALAKGNLTDIFDESLYADQVIQIWRESVKMSPVDSFVTHVYITNGSALIQELQAMRQKTTRLLSSSLKSV